MLIEQILKGVGDKRLLSDHKPGPSPLDDLIQSYSKIASINDDLPNLEETATGRDLKDAIRLMAPKDQVALLYRYCQAIGDLKEPERYDVAIEEHRGRWWLIKGAFFLAAFLMTLIGGGVIVVGAMRGDMTNPAATGLLNSAMEIFKLIFSSGIGSGG